MRELVKTPQTQFVTHLGPPTNQRADVGVVYRSFIRTAIKPLAGLGEVMVSVEVLATEDETLS